MNNPYTCRLLRRFDWVIHKVMRHRVEWSGNGRLVRVSPAGVRWETITFFPGWMYRAAADIQNRWIWTRRILSA